MDECANESDEGSVATSTGVLAAAAAAAARASSVGVAHVDVVTSDVNMERFSYLVHLSPSQRAGTLGTKQPERKIKQAGIGRQETNRTWLSSRNFLMAAGFSVPTRS